MEIYVAISYISIFSPFLLVWIYHFIRCLDFMWRTGKRWKHFDTGNHWNRNGDCIRIRQSILPNRISVIGAATQLLKIKL